MALTWHNDLLTGVSEIDIQHRELFNLINRFFDACDQGKGREEIKYVFEFLNNYIVSHFNIEEAYMTKHNYPGYTEHKQMHKDFKKDFAELEKKLDDAFNAMSTLNTLRTQIETNWLLGQWWVNHINKTDKALGIFLKSKEI